MAPTHSKQVTAAPGSKPTVKQTIVETIEASRLEDITTIAFVSFKEKREIYERQIREKNHDANTSVPLTSYRNSIAKPILCLFMLASWVNPETFDTITEAQLMACINERVRIEPVDSELAMIERALLDVRLERAGSSAAILSVIPLFSKITKEIIRNIYRKHQSPLK